MKKKKLKLFSILFSAITMVNNVFPAFAYDVDTEDNSIESVEYQNNEDIDFENSSNVFAQLGSEYKVTIPKVVVLSGASKDAKYFVKVEGDIAGYEQVTVVPEKTFLLNSKNKDSQTATITQDKTIWSVHDFNTDASGTISAEDITAGTWEGNFDFNINLAKVAGDIETPKLLLNTTNLSMGVGKSHQVQAFYEDKDVTKEVDWSSDNEKFTVIDGLVMTSATAQVGDSATITATLDKDLSARNFLESSGLVLTAFAEDEALVASFSVTVVGIEVKDKDENVVNSVSVNPGKSVTLTASIIPETNDTVSWHATAPAGVLLVKNGNQADIYVAKDMPINNAYYIVVTYGDYAKTIILNVVPEIHTHTNGKEIEENRIEPTCEKDGSYDKVVYCSTCGEEISRTTITIDKLGHVLGNLEITEEPTCEKDGKKEQKCNRCNKVVNTEIIDSLGHDYVEGVCARCGSKLSDLVINASGYEGTFDNKEHSVNVVSEGSTIEYSTDNKVFSDTNPSFIDAGIYTVYYKVSKPGYKTVIDSKQVVINKAKSVVSAIPSAKNIVYTGKEQTLINPGTAVNGTIKYKLNDGEYSENIPTVTNAGKYTVYYKVFGNDNYEDTEESSIEVIVEKAESNITPPTTKTNLRCDGTEQVLIDAGSSTTGTVKYKLDDGEYSEKLPVASKAGEYTVYYKVFGDKNYNDTEENLIKVNINKAPGNVVPPTAKTKLMCDGTEQVLINAGSSDTGIIEYKIDDGEYSSELPKVTKGGTYKVYYRVTGDETHEDVTEDYITVSLTHTPSTTATIENVKSSTCAEVGSYDEVIYCVVCKKEMSRITKTTTKSDHIFDERVKENIVEPTCTKPGTYNEVAYCEVCHEEISRIQKEIPPLGHAYTNDVCDRCGFKYVAGLYDGNGNMIKTWDELVALGLDSTCSNGAAILTNNNLSGYLIISNNVTSLADYAFYNCQNIKGVEIPGSVKSIGYRAFESCNSLTKLTLYEGTESIQARAFWDTRIPELVIPDTVTTIGAYAFYSNVVMESVVVPNSVTSIGAYAFDYCSKLKHVKVGKIIGTDDLQMFSLHTAVEDVEVLDGAARIGSYGFYNIGTLKKISIPDSVTSIGYRAFESCTALQTVNSNNVGECVLPKNLISIESRAFWDTRFINVIIPDKVTTIGAYAFYSNVVMDSIFIPNSVTSIGAHALDYCSKLKHVKVGKIIETNDLQIFSICPAIEDVIILDGVTRIGSYGFYNLGNLKKITLSDSVESIGYRAFESCTALQTLNSDETGKCIFPKNLISIESRAFWDTRFVDVTISDKVTTIGAYAFYSNVIMDSLFIPNSVTSMGTNVFDYCSKLKHVKIGKIVGTNDLYFFSTSTAVEDVEVLDGATRIGSYAFYNVGTLSKVMLPDSIESIGYRAFESCTALQTISSIKTGTCKMPKNLTSIESRAFWDTRLIDVVLQNGIKSIDAYAFYSNVSMKSIVIPNTVETIGAYAFAYCSVLDNLLIPSSVTSIGASAFESCKGLKYLKVGKIIETNDVQMFSSGTSLKDVEILDGVTRIGSYAFYNIGTLSKIILPDSIESIGYRAFESCTSLQTISSDETGKCIFPKNLTSIESRAFWDTRLVDVVLQNGIKSIGAYAFYSNVVMDSIFIPNSVTSVGAYAFDYCSKLKHVKVGKIIETDNLQMFSLHTAVEDIEVLNGVTRLGTYAFYNLGNLAKASIPDSVTSIGYSAFESCTALQTINSNNVGECRLPKNLTSIEGRAFWDTRFINVIISNKVETIGAYAFYSNVIMDSLFIPNSVTSMGTNVFDYCSKLKHVKIGKIVGTNDLYFFSTSTAVEDVEVLDGATRIGSYAFYNVGTLSKVILPDSIESIGYRAFESCTALQTMNSDEVGKCILPKNLTSIESRAFWDTRFKNITMLNKITTIGPYAFYSNINMKSISVPNSVTSIGAYAFAYCSSLSEIAIPKNASVGENAFLSTPAKVNYK